MLAVFLKGFILCIASVSSIGMQNLFVFNNALSNRLKRALGYAAFVWVADTSLVLVAFFGMGAILAKSELLRLGVMLAGGLVVLLMGWQTIRSAHATQLNPTTTTNQTTKKVFLSAWVVTWGNPQALIDTSLMFGALRATLQTDEVWFFIAGILLASATWFYGISAVLSVIRQHLPRKFMLWVYIISGGIIMVYGAYLLLAASRLLFKLI